MRLTDEVYLVGGGPIYAFGLSNAPDSHVYLVDSGDELALIDCGMADGDSLEQITANIRDEGLDPDRLRYLLITHYHIDHVGGAARFRARFGIEVLGAPATAAALRTGDERGPALDVAKQRGVYRADYSFEPCEVARELAEGDRVRVGNREIEVLETPGHCDGHLAYRLLGRNRRYLFSGDAVFYGGRLALQNIPDSSIQLSAKSVARLAQVEFDALLPGHQAITLTNGQRHVQLAVNAFRQLTVPKALH